MGDFDKICTENMRDSLSILLNYYDHKPIELYRVNGKEDKISSVDAILNQLGHIVGKGGIIVEMLEKFEEIKVCPPIELKHIIPYAEEVAKLAENRNDVCNLIKGLSERFFNKSISYHNYHSMLAQANGIMKLKDSLDDIVYFLEKTFDGKGIHIFNPEIGPFNYADNVLILANNKKKVEKLNDLLGKRGYDSLNGNFLFSAGDKIVEAAYKYKQIKKELEQRDPGSSNFGAYAYPIIEKYSSK